MVETREIQIGSGPQKVLIHQPEDIYDSTTGRVMTGSWLWDSALFLSLFISSYDFTGKTVLELGAGTGLPGLTASRLGADRVILTDLAPLLPNLVNNVEINGLSGRVEVCELVWGSDKIPSQLAGGVDVIMMSDVFYDTEMMEGLAKTMGMVCRRDTTVWAATEARETAAGCLVELGSLGFEAMEVACQWRSSVRGVEVDKENDGGVWNENENEMLLLYLIKPPNAII